MSPSLLRCVQGGPFAVGKEDVWAGVRVEQVRCLRVDKIDDGLKSETIRVRDFGVLEVWLLSKSRLSRA
jgi:hypothetical protein